MYFLNISLSTTGIQLTDGVCSTSRCIEVNPSGIKNQVSFCPL